MSAADLQTFYQSVKDIAIGVQQPNITTARDIIAIGNGAAQSVVSATQGVYIGTGAGNQITAVNDNVFCGFQAGGNATTATGSVLVGSLAGQNVTTGQHDVAVGFQTLAGNPYTGSNSVACGYRALAAATSGGSNVAIGYQAGDATILGSSNIILGSNADTVATPSQATASSVSNQFVTSPLGSIAFMSSVNPGGKIIDYNVSTANTLTIGSGVNVSIPENLTIAGTLTVVGDIESSGSIQASESISCSGILSGHYSVIVPVVGQTVATGGSASLDIDTPYAVRTVSGAGAVTLSGEGIVFPIPEAGNGLTATSYFKVTVVLDALNIAATGKATLNALSSTNCIVSGASSTAATTSDVLAINPVGVAGANTTTTAVFYVKYVTPNVAPNVGIQITNASGASCVIGAQSFITIDYM